MTSFEILTPPTGSVVHRVIYVQVLGDAEGFTDPALASGHCPVRLGSGCDVLPIGASAATRSCTGRRARDSSCRRASCSRGLEADVYQLRAAPRGGQDVPRSLSRRGLARARGLHPGCGISQHPGQVCDLGNPPAVTLTPKLDLKSHVGMRPRNIPSRAPHRPLVESRRP